MTRNYLALDASTYAGSAAIVTEGGVVIVETTAAMRGQQEERLMPAVASLFATAAIAPRELSGVICGSGPGSFTSLRIATSIAKGLAAGLAIPLYATSSLLLIPAALGASLAAGRYIALLDAMRSEFHALRFDVDSTGRIAEQSEVFLCGPDILQQLAAVNKEIRVTEIGPGRAFDAFPHARGAARLIADILAAGPVSLDEWEPIYGRLAEAEVKLRAAAGNPVLAQP